MRPKITPTDRQPPRKQAYDARGRSSERFSEYFDFRTWPEKEDRKVTRGELLAILTRKWRVEVESKWYRRLWAWLTSRHGSTMKPVGGGIPDPTGEQPRGA